jgi:ATP phosphoribosyltransferase regulatory subunit
VAWQLPPGIEDLLPPRAAALEAIRTRLLALYAGWGYELVIPPLVEYADALLTGTGADLGAQTFRMADPLSGALLGVRADITPQVARIDARHSGAGVARYCYLGSVLTTTQSAPGAPRNPVQAGAELYGHTGSAADVEVLRLLLATLETTGTQAVQLDLGHVGIYRALARGAGLDPETEHELFVLLQRKAEPDVRALVRRLDCPAAYREWLTALPRLYGDAGVLDVARSRFADAPEDVRATACP